MAYTIEKTPRVVDFALNPFGFELESPRDRWYRFQMLFSGIPVPGSYIEIKWSDKTCHYDLVEAADESGTQITASTATDSAIVLSELVKNTLFNSTWEQRLIGLYFYEKNITDYYPVEVKSNCPELVVNYSDIKFLDPLKLVSELFVKHNGESEFTSKGLAFHPINYSGIASINLKNRVIEGFNPYTPTVGDTSNHAIALIEYYLKLWEHHANDAVAL